MSMQQNYVCLHTLKNLEEIEKSVKQLGMEVIFKSSYASVDAEELSEEERIAWIDGLEQRLARNLEYTSVFSKTLEDLAHTGKKHASEIYSLLKQYRENPSKKILDSIKMLDMIADSHFKYQRDVGLTASPYSMLELIASPGIYAGTSVNVSCLIARKGENIVKYISIRDNNDPILTIMGPEASSIKEMFQD